jgi:hypothetical protein
LKLNSEFPHCIFLYFIKIKNCTNSARKKHWNKKEEATRKDPTKLYKIFYPNLQSCIRFPLSLVNKEMQFLL